MRVKVPFTLIGSVIGHRADGRDPRYRARMDPALRSDRLLLRDWTVDDAEAAFAIYGSAEVAEWLTPAMQQVPNPAAMRSVLEAWIEAQPNMMPPTGHWALVRRADDAVIGGVALRLLPPYEEDIEIAWQIRPDEWGNGYATEGSRVLMRWAFTRDVDELFAVARPNNTRAIATARNLGMEWVGETTKYYNLRLQVFRIRPADLGGGDA
ncbi:RimJ/RimL family protein N-acetyltransferase [Halopolyspora algeriensis]|uniref:RimJ/RimL family protein N-acetyltransferase n=2 Tax=Halopolyspora algeriensis TaxID=1500506 RepID=A0A368VNN4_9ACTN|nr:RimJ/RimL family protein N-acetyltransferase [Halopolyspora algeriensis]TQM56188.1 RimJ/RimL family protein N-acetyltransferase [Halopolyspora algeriensis]